jgi:hypothetical protein
LRASAFFCFIIKVLFQVDGFSDSKTTIDDFQSLYGLLLIVPEDNLLRRINDLIDKNSRLSFHIFWRESAFFFFFMNQ